MEELLLFNISNNAVPTYLMYGSGLGKVSNEAIKIMPHYPFLKIGMNYLFVPLKPVLQFR
jgi:hypothetical protein